MRPVGETTQLKLDLNALAKVPSFAFVILSSNMIFFCCNHFDGRSSSVCDLISCRARLNTASSGVQQLDEMKKSCHTHCFSTLNHNLGFCYNDTRVIEWVLKQAAHGFQG